MCDSFYSFRKRFRVSKEIFRYILNELQLDPGLRSTRISPTYRLCATLELLASGSYQWTMSNDFVCPLGQSTISETVHGVLKIMQEKLCPMWIKFDPNQSSTCKEYFMRKHNIPGVIGLIDGTHIMLLKPREDEHIFFNRKSTHSLNAMVICDEEKRILSICAQYGGSSHDSFVWRQSPEKFLLESGRRNNNKNGWLLGDSGYPLEPWLMTPFRNPPAGSAEANFNFVHAQARSNVEQCIGILKGRWRVLMEERRSRYSPERVGTIVNVCAALHNICIHFRVPFTGIIAPPDDSQLHHDYDNSVSCVFRKQAEKIRHNLKNNLV